MSLQQLQEQLGRTFDQMQALSTELASVNAKVDFLNTDRISKDQVIVELRDANRQLVDSVQRGAAGRGAAPETIKLIDMKTMNPKKFDGKPESPFKAWAKSVRTYCNATRPGFRKFLRWIESQSDVIDYSVLSRCDWSFKDAANEALYDFLVLHTSDDAQQLVELQDENGLEAWRQLALRFDPVGESYVFDQMSALMDVPRCKQIVDIPAAITRWERSFKHYAEKTGGQAVPEFWKLPI